MRNFQLVREGLDTAILLNGIARHSNLWNTDKTRTSAPGTPHEEVDDIILRFGPADLDSIVCWDRSWMDVLDGFKDTALTVMAMVKGSMLGRVMITRLAPGKGIAAHVDEGKYAEWYTRFHLILQGHPGTIFRAGNETVNMLTGQLWWFNNRIEHEVRNNSSEDRISLIVDVRIDK